MSSKTLDELYRRERIAYEQCQRHRDEPSGRLYNLWRDKYNKVNAEINEFIKNEKGAMDEVDLMHWLRCG